MKRVLKLNKIEVEIIAVLNIQSDIAADVELEYREMDFKYQLTNAQLMTYQDFVRTVVAAIDKRGFEIIEQYQSSKSYSYYIQFTPEPYKGFEDQMLELDVKFRLSDHYPEHGGDSLLSDDPTNRTRDVIFKGFVVEGVTHDNVASVILDINEICNDLKRGDYSRLM